MNLDWQLIENCKIKVSPIPKNCFKAFDEKGKNKVLMCDESKILYIADFNNKQPSFDHKSNPYEKSINATCISDELIFFNVGSQVKAINRKGKQVYSFETYMAQSVRNLLVYGYKMWIIGDTLINEFEMSQSNLLNNKSRKNPPNSTQKTQQTSYYMSQDTILDSRLYVQRQNTFCLICRKNNQLQIIDRGQIIAFYKTDSTPTSCNIFKSPQENESSPPRYIVGLNSGHVICVDITMNAKTRKRQFNKIWTIEENGNKITFLTQFSKGILVNKSNYIEIWTGGVFQQKRGLTTSYELGWKKQLSQSVSELIYVEDRAQILYATFTGKVYSLMNYEKQIELEKNTKKDVETKTQLQTIRRQLQILENEHKQIKAKQALKMGTKIQKYKFAYTSNLNPSKFCYVLQLSSSLPMTGIVFHGRIKIKTDKQVVFDGENMSKQQHCVIKLENEMVSQIQFNAVEGTEEVVNCYVSLKGDKQIINSFNIEIKPLSLHYKIDNSIGKQFKNLERMNCLLIEGKFSKPQINSWIASILPEMQKTSAEDEVTAVYQSLITKTKLILEMKQGYASFRSESLNPLIIIRKFISKKAKEREIPLRIKLDPNIDSVQNTLKSIEPRILQFEQLEKEYNLIPGLQELKTQQQGYDKFNQDFKRIIDSQEKIKTQYKQISKNYEDLKLSLFELYKSYQSSRDKEVSDFDRDNFLKKISNFKLEEIKNLIIN